MEQSEAQVLVSQIITELESLYPHIDATNTLKQAVVDALNDKLAEALKRSLSHRESDDLWKLLSVLTPPTPIKVETKDEPTPTAETRRGTTGKGKGKGASKGDNLSSV